MTSHVHYHLSHALDVMRREKDYRKWGPLIDALPDAAREPCRLWLREEARKRQMFERVSGAAARKHG